LHSSRLIAALASAVAFGAAAGGARAQTSPPVMTMAPMPAPAGQPSPVSAPVPQPGTTVVPLGPVPSAPEPESSAPLPPVHTMAPRPLPSGGTAPGGMGPNLNPNTIPGSPALNARSLAARRTATGYVLSGQAQVKDGCQAARFDGVSQGAGASSFTLVQYRNPRNVGVMCTQLVRWVTAAPRTVTTAKPPSSITVRTAAGTKRVSVH
jgi:hypothetical protein